MKTILGLLALFLLPTRTGEFTFVLPSWRTFCIHIPKKEGTCMHNQENACFMRGQDGKT